MPRTTTEWLTTWLSTQWPQMDERIKSLWPATVPAMAFGRYDSFVDFNIRRFTQALAPTQFPTAPGIQHPPDWLVDYLPCKPLPNGLNVLGIFEEPHDAWGYAVYLSDHPPVPCCIANLVMVQRLTEPWYRISKLRELKPGTQYLRGRAFTKDGRWGDPTEFSVVQIPDDR